MEILAAIAADPTLLPLWAVMLFAAGMYPVGMMFGCSPCCDPCTACTQGSLPDTLTVALSGIPETTKGPDLATLSFSACYGSGASGAVTAPGQSAVGSNLANDRGPITAVSLTGGGGGYARLGRAAPTVEAAVDSEGGSGAVFDVTLTKMGPDDCGLHYWTVSGVTLIDGGSGYTPADDPVFEVAEGDTIEYPASARLLLQRLPPDLTLAVASPSGSGAELSVSLSENSSSPTSETTWGIASVTVVDGGDGYTHLDAVSVTLAEGSELEWGGTSAALHLITDNAEPTLSASVQSASGSGASLSISLTKGVSSWPPGSAVWSVESITVDAPGSGYAEWDYVPIAVVDGDARSGGMLAFVTEVDGNGGIVAVTAFGGGEFFKGGPITGVQVDAGGTYFKRDGTLTGVELYGGGKYYREDPALPPYIAPVTVEIAQTAPSQGSGASISATVGSDPANAETFGKITGLTINNGGTGYLAYELFPSCLGRFNGRSIVVRRNYPFWQSDECCPFFPMSLSPKECTYGYTCANIDDPCSLEAEAVRVEYRGPNEPTTVFLMLHQRGQTTLPLGGNYYYPAAYGTLAAQENVENCSEIDLTAYGTQWLPPEATAHITAGGTYEESDACRRITTEDMAALYVDVSWGDATTGGSGSLCGWRSRVFFPSGSADSTESWCQQWKDNQDPGRWETGFEPFCSESQTINDGVLNIARDGVVCSYRWAFGTYSSPAYPLSLIVVISRWMGFGYFYPVNRRCVWEYPATVVYDEETLLPTGLTLGAPSYISELAGASLYATLGDGDDRGPFWYRQFFGNLMDENTVCQNPGTPTVTISSLP